MTEDSPSARRDVAGDASSERLVAGGLVPIEGGEDAELVEMEKWIRDRLSQQGHDRIEFDDKGLSVGYRIFRGTSSIERTELAVPRASLKSLREQLASGFIEHPQYVGYIVPGKGLAEIALERAGGQVGASVQLIKMVKASNPACSHAEEEAWIPILPSGPLMTRAVDPEGNEYRRASRVHLVRRDGAVCIELSHCSPLISPMLVRANERPRYSYSLKFYFDERLSESEIIEECEEILHAFLYELNSRNSVVFNPIRRVRQDDSAKVSKRIARTDLPGARFPLTVIRPEVARLFGFASQASRNLPIAFLSYYQTLEYFVFTMMRRAIIRDVRNQILDRKFDERKESSLIDLIGIVERGSGRNESQQLGTLIKECVREGQVVAFLEEGAWGNHFTAKGPIGGVTPLNAKSRDAGILDQVAERVYKIRNRIVHAKDDPRYGDAKVLMPESPEADALGPDVQLVRLLSMEVILESQGR